MRKTETVAITAAGRDMGKVFSLTEMSAVAAEKWATRALFALGRNGVDVPDDLMTGGMAGLVALGIRTITSLAFEDAEPLLDEMMECVSFVPDPAKPEVLLPWGLAQTQVEEVATLLRLRDEVVNLHVGFSIAAAISTLGKTVTAAITAAGNASDTETSPKSSD